MILFPDTNFFLQCKAIDSLPWRELVSDSEVNLFVCAPVFGEIDSFKGSGDSRKSDRARKANSIFLQSIQSADGRCLLRKSNPKITIQIYFDDANFDAGSNDVKFLRIVERYASSHPAETVQILSRDTGVYGRAKYMKIPALLIPETWLIAPQIDERDKRIRELESQIAKRVGPLPNISMEAKPEIISVHLPRFRKLTDAEVKTISEKIFDENPQQTEFEGFSGPPIRRLEMGLFGRMQIRRITEDEIRAYRKKYTDWMQHIVDFLDVAHLVLQGPSQIAKFSIYLVNNGMAPAESCRVRAISSEGIEFLHKGNSVRRSRADEGVRLPTPPKYLEVRVVDSLADSLEALRELQRAPFIPHIGNTPFTDQFSWHRNQVSPQEVEITCDLFRHQQEPKKVSFVIAVDRDKSGGEIQCECWAANLAETTLLRIPIRIEVIDSDILTELNQIGFGGTL